MNDLVGIMEMHQLINELGEACEAYYKYDKPIMSDREYDEKYDRLETLEKTTSVVLAGSPTQKVQGYVLDGFKKIPHSKPMLSAAKTKDIAEIKKFLGGNNWYCSGKLDGLTVVVVYEGGNFIQGITRGNGIVGEDITDGCRFIKNLPMKIPYQERLEIRGECVMDWDEFNRINEGLVEKYSHPRNLAAGTIRQLDLNVIRDRKLSFVAFECVSEINDSKQNELDFLTNNGFETVIRMGHNQGSPDQIATLMEGNILANKYPYDGLVFEIDSNTVSKKLGKTAHHESCRMALKWEDELIQTTLRDIEWQVSKNGTLSPVAVFDEVDLGGALTTKATLHNLTYIKNLELGIGDTIEVMRANLVIPRVENNLTRSNNLRLPDKCPMCGGDVKVVKSNDTEVLVCGNENCPGRILGLWKTFVSKKGMDIDGLSEATLATFLRHGYLTNMFVSIYEIYNYKKELYKLDGFGKKSIDKLIGAIEDSKDVDLIHFLTAFSIPGIGASQSKVIAARYHTFKEFMDACDNGDDFSMLPGFGKVLNANLHTWWVNNHYQMIDVAGVVRFKEKDPAMPKHAADYPLAGKTFVVTGSVSHWKNRDELKAEIEAMGGVVTGSVSKKTDYLINNDVTSTSGKNQKAHSLGIPIISEEEFIKMFIK